MAEKKTESKPGVEDAQTMQDFALHRELEAVVDILDYFENHGARIATVMVEKPKDCEEECLVIAADAKINRPKKALGNAVKDSVSSYLSRALKTLTGPSSLSALLFTKYTKDEEDPESVSYKVTLIHGTHMKHFRGVISYNHQCTITEGEDKLEYILEHGPLKASKRFVKLLKSMSENSHEVLLMVPMKRTKPFLKVSVDGNDIHGKIKPFATGLKAYLQFAKLLPRTLVAIQNLNDDYYNMLFVRSLCQSETMALELDTDEVPTSSGADTEKHLMTVGYTTTQAYRACILMYKDGRLVKCVAPPSSRKHRRDRSKYQLIGIVHEIGEDSGIYEAIENAAKEEYWKAYEVFKSHPVKITRPAETWAQCKDCMKWRLIISDQPEAYDRKCTVFNVLSSCDDEEDTLLPSIGFCKLTVPQTPARKRRASASPAPTPASIIRAGTPVKEEKEEPTSKKIKTKTPVNKARKSKPKAAAAQAAPAETNNESLPLITQKRGALLLNNPEETPFRPSPKKKSARKISDTNDSTKSSESPDKSPDKESPKKSPLINGGDDQSQSMFSKADEDYNRSPQKKNLSAVQSSDEDSVSVSAAAAAAAAAGQEEIVENDLSEVSTPVDVLPHLEADKSKSSNSSSMIGNLTLTQVDIVPWESRRDIEDDFQSLPALSSASVEDAKDVEINRQRHEIRMERARHKYLCEAVREHLSNLSPGSVTAETECEEMVVLLTLINLRVRWNTGHVLTAEQRELLNLSDSDSHSSSTPVKQGETNDMLRRSVISYCNKLAEVTGGNPTTVPLDSSPEQLVKLLNGMIEDRPPKDGSASPRKNRSNLRRRSVSPRKSAVSPRKTVSEFHDNN